MRDPRIVAAFLLLAALLIALNGTWRNSNAQVESIPQPLGIPTILDFGAVGHDDADDTEAIRKAIQSPVGEIRFPRGVYHIRETIVINLDKLGPKSLVADGTARVVMSGPGPAFKFVGTHGGTASPNTVKPEIWEKERTPMIDGIEIVGEHPEAVGIEATGTMQAIFTRVSVRKALHGIHLTKRNRNVIIGDCHIYENRGVGIYLDGLNLHQVNIANSHISYNNMGGIVVRDSEIRNLQITGCDIEGNMGENDEPTANILVDATNGSVREGAIVGCTIQHTHNAPNSANIRFLGTSSEVANKIGHFCISDNAMSDVAVNVHIVNSRGVVLTANTFWQGYEHNLLVQNSSNIVVGPNLFDRNPDYGKQTTNALVFRNCSDCTLTGLHINNVLESSAGLLLEKCNWMNLTGCTVLDCDGAGIALNDCDQCRVSDCLIRDTREGHENDAAIHIAGKGVVDEADNLLHGRVIRDMGETK